MENQNFIKIKVAVANKDLIGRKVEKIAPKDYTQGRTGLIEEINGDRLRVRWLKERDGKNVFFGTKDPNTGNGVRTWVNKKLIALIN